jgi:putative membrane protein insertion efficiency factor
MNGRPGASSGAKPPSERTRIGFFAWLLIGFVRLYQYTLAWFLGGHCRFQPSCSNYALECLRTHGAWRGALLSAKRVSRCHPFHPGGYDPPPPRIA